MSKSYVKVNSNTLRTKLTTAITRPCYFYIRDADIIPSGDPECMLVGDRLVHGMTCYEDEPPKMWMCSHCAEAYIAFWQEQWDEYYGIVREGLIPIREPEPDYYLLDRYQGIEDELNELRNPPTEY